MEQFNTMDLTKEEVFAVTIAMLGVAQVDGIKPEEKTLIRDFYSAANSDSPEFEDFEAHWNKQGYDIQTIVLEQQKREFLVYLSLMTAYADGHMSSEEETFISELALKINIKDEQLSDMMEDVKDELLSTLSKLPDSVGVAKVAAEM